MFENVRQHIPHLKGNIILHQPPGQESWLRVSPENHRHLLRRYLLFHIKADRIDNIGALGTHIVKLPVHNGDPASPGRREFFGKPFCIMTDEPSCPVHNLLTASVIDIQNHPLCFRIIFLKSQHDFRFGSPKTIDGLVIVADNKQIGLLSRQHFHNFILNPVDILKFIHQNIRKALLPHL